jgi:hypothetical protein
MQRLAPAGRTVRAWGWLQRAGKTHSAHRRRLQLERVSVGVANAAAVDEVRLELLLLLKLLSLL